MLNKLLHKIVFLFILALLMAACKNTNLNTGSTLVNEAPVIKIISEEEAKEVIIDQIRNSEDYRQYYIIESPKFDERVRSISWGETIYVKRIDNPKYADRRKGDYYILTGVMPDGQVLAAEIVDAQTGENIRGMKFLSVHADVLRIITPAESMQYANRYLKGSLKCTPVFFFDGTLESGHELLTWRYLVEPVSSDAITRGFKGSDYILLDPYIQNFKTDNSVRVDNGFLSRAGYPHRAFRIDGSRENEVGKKMVPID